jgi:hypothetical protein
MTDTPVSCDGALIIFVGASARSRMSSDAAAWRVLHVALSLTGNTFDICTRVDGLISKELETTGNRLINLLYTVFLLTQVSTFKILLHALRSDDVKEHFHHSQSLVCTVPFFFFFANYNVQLASVRTTYRLTLWPHLDDTV